MTTIPSKESLLHEIFGFSEFREGQEAVVNALLTSGKALAVFPTGGGKSLTYQLSALCIEGLTVVVSPLIALMKDQIDFLLSRGVAAARLDSSIDSETVRETNRRIESGELKLLYVAPERFNNERFLTQLQRVKVGLFAIDEAHCISEWGHNFRPDYLKLAQITKSIGAERILTLTATATPSVVADICQAFDIPQSDAILTGFYRPNLTMLTTAATPADRNRQLLDRLRSRPAGSTIIYVTLQKTAETVAAWLQNQKLSAEAYHAGMDPEARTRVQEWWKQSNSGIVVATIAFGMGIDKSDVRYVYHLNLPKSLESYSQEIGRAGRDGLPSYVELFASEDDLPTLENFVYGDTPEREHISGLIREMLEGPEEFDVSNYDLSNRHNLRPLVLRTSLTYLELAGALQKGTPYYAGYEFRPLRGLEAMFSAFPGEPGQFVTNIVANAKRGRIWFGVDPALTAERLQVDRRRVIRALEVLQERELLELRSSDVRDRYRRLLDPTHQERLTNLLMDRFNHREAAEIERLRMVTSLVTAEECQVNRLVGYFGEHRTAPCGHCSYCITQIPTQLPPRSATEPLAKRIPRAALSELKANFPLVFDTPRQMAKFLCGLTSPAFTKAKLSRHSLFGVAEEDRFLDVVEYVTGA